MIEASADRLVLVNAGRAQDFPGDLDDYTDQLLGREPATATPGATPGATPRANRREDRKAAAQAREALAHHRKAQKAAEAELARLTARLRDIDRALFDPASATPADAKRTASDLMQERGRTAAALEAAEAQWLAAGEALEQAG
jgi:ATP-binding cassette subfamily F protein 3